MKRTTTLAALALLLPAAAGGSEPTPSTPLQEAAPPAAAEKAEDLWEKQTRERYGEVPPQPADGAYTISAEWPARDCYWMMAVQLRAGEDHSSFFRRAWDEYYEQGRKELMVIKSRNFTQVMRDPEAPEVKMRGLVLRNPAAPEGSRDIIWPWYRDNYADDGSMNVGLYSNILSVEFKKDGIWVRKGRRQGNGLILAQGLPSFWSWGGAADFLAALPALMEGTPPRQLPLPAEMISAPLRERLEAGRRLLLFYGDPGLPMEAYWDTLAQLVAVAGGQSVSYIQAPGVVLTAGQYEAKAREIDLLSEPGGDEAGEPLQPKAAPPDMEVQPVLELDIP